jgi:formiminoglutamase
MEILQYFDFVNKSLVADCDRFLKSPFGKNIQLNTEDNPLITFTGIEIALMGVPEDRNSDNSGCSQSPDIIRKYLYSLNKLGRSSITDLGNLKRGNTVNDTYAALRDVVVELFNNNIIPLVLGGSQDLTFSVFTAYEKLEQTINIVSIDSRFDFGEINNPIFSSNYLGKIISQKSKCLFNFTNLGYQTYNITQEEIDLMKNILFDNYRLGFLQSSINEAEPSLRDASLVSFDISAVRQSDAPGHFYASPNGFYGEEACQLAR